MSPVWVAFAAGGFVGAFCALSLICALLIASDKRSKS